MNSLEDKYKSLFGAYLGMQLMDNYSLKEYCLLDIKHYIDNYIATYPIDNFDYYEFMKNVDKEQSDIVKLQDTLRIAKVLNFDNDLIYLIKEKIRILKHEKD